MFQILEAIKKNVCAPGPDELDEFTISRAIRASTKMEGDSQLGLLLFVGVCCWYNYGYPDISALASLEYEEYQFKRNKFHRKLKSNDKRFLNKVKLIGNYLRLVYGV